MTLRTISRMKLLRLPAAAVVFVFAPFAQAIDMRPPPDATVQESVIGKVFADGAGRTLYTVTLDLGGECTHNSSTEFFETFDCRSRFPVFAASAEAQAQGAWTVVTRKDDGTRQWAYQGKPVYTYILDRHAGTVNGESLYHYGRMARALRVPRVPLAGFLASDTALGEVLADSAGMTLYQTKKNTSAEELRCTGRCAATWRPMPAAAIAGSAGDFAPVTRSDGTRQWSYRQGRLYTCTKDLAPGATQCHGIDGLHAIVLKPKEPPPPGVTIEKTLVGEVYADAQGHTLYGYFGLLGNDLKALKPLCGDRCGTIWQPALAPAGAQFSGSWSLTPLAGGGNQITFKGYPLYTFAEEIRKGDLLGNRYGRFVWEWMLAVLVNPKDDTTR